MTHDRSAEISARVDAPPERVWHALTDAQALTAWYWPPALEPVATSDPVVGGRFAMATRSADMGFSGEYLALDEPRRIVQSWRWAGDDRDSRVTIELVAAGDGTDLRIVHDGLDEDTARSYREGWETCLARLPAWLVGGSGFSGSGFGGP